MSQKLKVTKSAFLGWYFTDKEDYLSIAGVVENELKATGKCTLTTERLFNESEYIPGWICEGNEDDTNEYSPGECTLIEG